MAQKSNLNVSPYFDDFDSSNNFYKVLFNPGFPVQARELTTSQSILQNQIEDFGSHIFKNGSVVIPGNLVFDNRYHAVKLNSTNFGIDISLYINNFVGKTITGKISNVSATVEKVALPTTDPVDDITIYVKYVGGNDNFETSSFLDGEALICDENVTYGNTTIQANTDFAGIINENATSIGSAASIGDGVFFIRGYFVNVSQQTILHDYYTNTPSYRVGLKITESFVGAKDDDSLYDNAKGFTNFAAPGADRLKITLTLTKKLLTDLDDIDFVELLRVDQGKLKKIQSKTQYNILKDYIAERTYDESGNYTTKQFVPSLHNSLNDNLGSNGIYFEDQKTDEGNTPSDDLAVIKLSPGRAYVRGYQVDKPFTSIVDVEKPRDTEKIKSVTVPFKSPNTLSVLNVHGVPKQGETIDLYSTIQNQPFDDEIGIARVYGFNLKNEYKDASSEWDLHLYDIQVRTDLLLNRTVSTSDIPLTSFVVGKNSGAVGFAAVAGAPNGLLKLTQTSGKFQAGETLQINGLDFPVGVGTVTTFGINDIKSVRQGGATNFVNLNPTAGDPLNFRASTVLRKAPLPNGTVDMSISSSGIATALNASGGFLGLKHDDIIIYNNDQYTEEVYNAVDTVGSGSTQVTLRAIAGVGAGVTDTFTGLLPHGDFTGSVRAFLGIPEIRTSETGLFAPLPDSNISSVDLDASNLLISRQITGETISNQAGGNLLVFDTSNLSGLTNVSFATFDEERYSVHLPTGISTQISDSNFRFSGANEITIALRDIIPVASATNNVVVNTTVQKNKVDSKIKTYNRSTKLNVTKSKYPASGSTALGGGASELRDGLTFNKFFGLRVQDEKISLNHPDVVKIIAIYESVDGATPTLDKLKFSASISVSDNCIVGENVIGSESGAVARVISTNAGGDPNSIEVVYLNDSILTTREEVTFDESKIETFIETITLGVKKDLTNSYKLDKGQNKEFYDYSSIVRNQDVAEPTRPLLVIFDHYTIPSNDTGDIFTVLSYDDERYATDIPEIDDRFRASDTIDFRPRVAEFTVDTKSPFDFTSRTFDSSSNIFLKPNEGSVLDYEYYLPRIDKLYLNTKEEFIVRKGVSARYPKPPQKSEDLLEIAQISYPAYLYNPQDAIFKLIDNRRYTMRDIGGIDNRVKNLETTTSLTLLELDTKTLQIQDSEGRNRFKSGFFVDDFSTTNFMTRQFTSAEINPNTNELVPVRSRNAIKLDLAPADLNNKSGNFPLIDSNLQKTGRAITLKYDEVGWLEQIFATTVENVNPFHVVVYTGNLVLDPTNDVWTRTVQLEDRNISTTRNNEINLNNNIDLSEFNFADINRRNINRRVANGRMRGATVTETRQSFGERRNENINQTTRSTFTTTDVSIRNVLISSDTDSFMRSRNTEFVASNLKPKTQYYHFLDNKRGVDLVPKLLEIKNSSGVDGSDGVFTIGETVVGSIGNRTRLRFRLAQPNHKRGKFDSPRTTYSSNPYKSTPAGGTAEALPVLYSQTSPVLNVDTEAMAEEAEGTYFGYVTKDMKLVGQESGAVAYVKDVRLISDRIGDVLGTFFLRDPNSAPPGPSVKVETGTKTFRLSSDPNNDPGLPGSSDVSFAEINYVSNGTVERWQNEVTTTNNVNNINLSTNIGFQVQTVNVDTITTQFYDPLAQTFVVGGNIEAPSDIDTNDDIDGAFLTAVEVFFGKCDQKTAPITFQMRTTELGIPTRRIIGTPVVLFPDSVVGTDDEGNDILLKDNTSSDASVGTKVTFPEPIWLPPGLEYALVLVSDKSMDYEVWTAIMNEPTVNTQNLPNAEQTTYSTQYAMGALFKSQNGSLWTENQYQDMKFKLYKANFTSNSGTAVFYNPDIITPDNSTPDENSVEVPRLLKDPIITLPKTGRVGIQTFNATDTTSNIAARLVVGRKIHAHNKFDNTAVISGLGGNVSQLGVSTGGQNYIESPEDGDEDYTAVDTYNITGSGSGLKVRIKSVGTNGQIQEVLFDPPDKDPAAVGVAFSGSGYQVGDIVGIVTSAAPGGTGSGAQLVINDINGTTTLFLTDIQGQDSAWTSSVDQALNYRDSTVTSGTVGLGTYVVTSYAADGGENNGQTLTIQDFEHGEYSDKNKTTLKGIVPDTPITSLVGSISATDTQLEVGAAHTSKFAFFEGVPVGASNLGYIKLGDEIISYNGVGSNTINNLVRGIDNTVAQPHGQVNAVELQKYEISGVSLRRINGIERNVNAAGIGIDSYNITFDNSANGVDRSADSSLAVGPAPELSFSEERFVGGDNVHSSTNIMFGAAVPTFNLLNPGSDTSTTASIRTVSGTSVGGSEVPFIDQGFEPVEINEYNEFSTPRLVASKLNENAYLTSLPRSKSLTMNVTLNKTASSALSPIIRTDTAFVELINHRLNNPVGAEDYSTDERVGSIANDPHSSTYMSTVVDLIKPATSLKVLISAYRDESADFRVMYALQKPDDGGEVKFELFPGYKNLIDTTEDGFGNLVIDPSKNDGRPDVFVPASLDNEFLEYQFTAENLPEFTGYIIKIVMSGTNQARPPRFKDLRTIAVR